jgi:general secretion pathway protein E
MNTAAEQISSGKKIGEILLELTSLTQSQLEEALTIQEEEGGRVGDILVRKNYLSNQDILRAVCIQLGLPYTEELKIDDIDLSLVKDLPITYAKNHNALPIFQAGNWVTVALSDPFNLDPLSDLRVLLDKNIKPVITSSLRLQEAINYVFEQKSAQQELEEIEDEDEAPLDLEGPIDILDATADDAPVIRFVNSMIFRAVKQRASDIHIEPYEREMVIRYRVDGVLHDILRQPKRNHAAISSRIKIMADLNIAEKRLPQDGRIKIKIAGKDIDIRLSTVPVQYGERLVMRILEKDQQILDLPTLGFHGENLKTIQTLAHKKHGIVYVTGPTGHGKTTTLMAMLTEINSPERMIITVEDPVEYEIKGISQIQVNPKIELTFAGALRSILRQNPDVIMVGETRDSETASIAMNASLTGHLVFSTVHANDAPSTVTRLVDMGVEPFLVASSILGVIAQRLIRTICPHCKEPHSISEFDQQILGIEGKNSDIQTWKGRGCHACGNTGYLGRTVIHELLLMDEHLQTLVMEGADAGQIARMARKSGMMSLRDDAINKVLGGISTVEEVIRATQET